MGAVAAGVSVVSGIVGLSQQSKAASAQKQALASQQEQQALQAQLSYIALKQQTYADQLNDYIEDSTRNLSYAQAQTALAMQQGANDIATANAIFGANVERANASVNQMEGDTQALRQQSSANEAAGQQTIAASAAANQEDQSIVNSFLKALGDGSQRQATIANVLDMASASGGVNEALSILLGTDTYDALRAGANIQRQQQVSDTSVGNAQALEDTSRGLNSADYRTAQLMNAAQATQGRYNADVASQDASFSKQIADAGFASTRAANDASYKIGILSDQSNRFSRDYLRQYNEAAVLKGAQLQNDVLKAQAASVKNVGFFDYLGLGLQGYNAYRQLK